MRWLLRLLPILAILVCARPALAFDASTQVWGGLFVNTDLVGTGTTSVKLTGWGEAQPRRQDGSTIGFFRFGIGVANLLPGFTIHVGYAFNGKYVDKGDNVIEHRIFQQLAYQTRLDHTLDLQLRFRFEERFGPGDGPIGYRARLLGRVAHYFAPDGPVFLVVSDEAFYSLNDTTWGPLEGFDQNRLFAGLGFAGMLPKSRFELGYLGLYVNKADPAVDHWDHIPAFNFYITL